MLEQNLNHFEKQGIYHWVYLLLCLTAQWLLQVVTPFWVPLQTPVHTFPPMCHSQGLTCHCPLDPSCSLDQQYQSSHAGRLTKHTQAVNGTSTPFQSQSRHNNRAANIDLMVQTFKTSYFSLLWLSESVVGSFLRNEILQINHLEEMNINRKVS